MDRAIDPIATAPRIAKGALPNGIGALVAASRSRVRPSCKPKRLVALAIATGIALCASITLGDNPPPMATGPWSPDAISSQEAPRPTGRMARAPLRGASAEDLPGGAAPIAAADPGLPPNFRPWWQGEVTHPFRQKTTVVPVAPTGLILAALAHSAQIHALNESVFISQSAITEAAGKFDPRAFVESRLASDSDPVGSTLTTGGPDRWIDTHWYASSGVVKQELSGAQLSISQQIGYEQSNSLYFVPPNQGTARLALTLTQPLLNGAGAAYNGSVMVLAEINSDIARDVFSRDLQTLLVDLHRNYWDLYLQRSALAQRVRLYRQAVVICDELNARRVFDSTRGQLLRAEAAVASREGALIRYRAAVHNAEARIRALVNDPALAPTDAAEMIPDQMPIRSLVSANLNDSLVTALSARPEILQGIKEVRAASVRIDVAANEVQPVLNAIIETYVSGLEGQADIGEAFGDQFSKGRPSYTGGLRYEVPLGGNRSAKARLCARQAELRQTTSQLEATTANVRAEVEIAVHDVETTNHEIVSKYRAMAAGQAEIDYQTARWRALPGDQQNAGFALDELLAAQERLAQAEFDFATAEANYNMALISLRHATGTMVNSRNLDEILQQPCFAQVKQAVQSKPAATAPVNRSPAGDTAGQMRPPVSVMAQQPPSMVQQTSAAQTQPLVRLLPSPWQDQPEQPSEPPIPLLGMRVDQVETR